MLRKGLFHVFMLFNLYYTEILFLVELSFDTSSGYSCWRPLIQEDEVAFRLFTIQVKIFRFLFTYTIMGVMCMSNFLLVFHIRKRDLLLSTSTSEEANRKKKVNSITLTAVVMTFAYIGLNLPYPIYQELTEHRPPVTKENYLNTHVQWNINRSLLDKISQVNCSVNFYLYCLTGRRFRNEVWKIL